MKRFIPGMIAVLLCAALAAGGCSKRVSGSNFGDGPNTADEKDIYDRSDEGEYDYNDADLEAELSEEETAQSVPYDQNEAYTENASADEPQPEEFPSQNEAVSSEAFSDPAESAAAEENTDTYSAGVTSKGYPIEVVNGITYINGVIIANKTYTLPSGYDPGDLTGECNSAFLKMQEAAAAEGIDLFIMSGYRSYELQESIYSRYCARDGKDAADTYSARPGHSEHQTGLAMDLNSLSSSFADTAEGKWLAENCWKYGFIIRYPADKVALTGYMYEPWHVRYVGDIAEEIYTNGLCLEEYFGITSSYS